MSGRLWKSNGRVSCHSKAVVWLAKEITPRCLTKASHRMKININKAVKEIIEPIDEMIFHLAYASG